MGLVILETCGPVAGLAVARLAACEANQSVRTQPGRQEGSPITGPRVGRDGRKQLDDGKREVLATSEHEVHDFTGGRSESGLGAEPGDLQVATTSPVFFGRSGVTAGTIGQPLAN